MYGASRITIYFRRYDEVLEGLKLELNARRAELVEKLWVRVGGQGQGPGARVPLTAIAACFSANSHPSVKSRQRTEAEVLREFVVRFEHVCNKQASFLLASSLSFMLKTLVFIERYVGE